MSHVDPDPVPEKSRQPMVAGVLPAAAQMHAALRTRIISGDLTPGMRLSEHDIAEQYALSRQPVREAFIRLAAEGLLEVRPQRGTFVTLINMGWVLDTRFIRESVEADIIRLAAHHAQPGDVMRLNQIIARQAALLPGDNPGLVALDEEFHSALAAIAGKTLVWVHLQSLKIHLDRVRHLISAVTPHAVMLDQHRGIVAAVAANDPARAEQAMRHHLRRVFDDLPAAMQLAPELFDKFDPKTQSTRQDPPIIL